MIANATNYETTVVMIGLVFMVVMICLVTWLLNR